MNDDYQKGNSRPQEVRVRGSRLIEGSYPPNPNADWRRDDRTPIERRQGGNTRQRPKHGRRWSNRSIIGSLLTFMAIGILAFLAFGAADRTSQEDGGSVGVDDGASALASDADAPVDADAEVPTATESANEGESGLVAPTAPFVRAEFNGKDLVLTGSVPNEELAASLVEAAQIGYAPFVTTDIVVDEELPLEPWLATTPQAAIFLQILDEGALVVSEGQVTLDARTKSDADVKKLSGIFETMGLSVVTGDVEITNLREAIYVIVGSNDGISLTGALPTEEIRAGLLNAAIQTYGENGVTDASTVDPNVAQDLWMYNPEILLSTIAAFPAYEIRLEGGRFSASLSGGAIFESGSAEVSPQLAQLMGLGVITLIRDPALTIAIEGHTDSDGPDDLNLLLSQERADAAAAFLIANGIEEERIFATGFGEASPAVPNDSEEGKAQNRRLDFSLIEVDRSG